MDGAACQSPVTPPAVHPVVLTQYVLILSGLMITTLPSAPVQIYLMYVLSPACSPQSCMQLLQMHNECQAACDTFQTNVARETTTACD